MTGNPIRFCHAQYTAEVSHDQEFEYHVPGIMYDAICKATCHYAIMHGESNWRWFSDMTDDMVGINYLAQVNSRPGPWHHFNKTTLMKMVKERKDHWIAIEGVKLANKKGARACFMSPGCIESACLCSSHAIYSNIMDMWDPKNGRVRMIMQFLVMPETANRFASPHHMSCVRDV